MDDDVDAEPDDEDPDDEEADPDDDEDDPDDDDEDPDESEPDDVLDAVPEDAPAEPLLAGLVALLDERESVL